MKVLSVIATAFVLCSTAWAQGSSALSDAQVRRLVIQESLQSYSGSCPCPYNTDRAGHRCGARSAFSRPGGASPICYDNQISDEQVRQYRQTHRAPSH